MSEKSNHVQTVIISDYSFEEIASTLVGKALSDMGVLVPPLMTKEEVAAKLNWLPSTVLDRKNEIGFVKTGKEVLFKPEDVNAFIAKNYHLPKRVS